MAVIQQTKALISFSEEKDITITENSSRMSLINNITSASQSFKSGSNSVLFINTIDTNKNPTDITQVLGLLAIRMPGSLSRSFDSKYMLGVYSFDTNEPFIILTTKDFASSYEGMLKWEKDMTVDLDGVFSISQKLGSTTPAFTDEALKNKDLRVVRDSQNNVVLLYSFIDKNTLVITGSENVFTAIVGKYLISKQAGS